VARVLWALHSGGAASKRTMSRMKSTGDTAALTTTLRGGLLGAQGCGLQAGRCTLVECHRPICCIQAFKIALWGASTAGMPLMRLQRVSTVSSSMRNSMATRSKACLTTIWGLSATSRYYRTTHGDKGILPARLPSPRATQRAAVTLTLYYSLDSSLASCYPD